MFVNPSIGPIKSLKSECLRGFPSPITSGTSNSTELLEYGA